MTSKQDHQKHKKHERALKKVTDLKKRAKKDFREAKKKGFPTEEIQSLARNFFDLVRSQSKLKKQSRQATQNSSSRRARQMCYKDFWKFTKELLDDSQASRIPPQFSGEQAHDFFSTTYQSQPRDFQIPPWMPVPHAPPEEFDTDPISVLEIQAAIKRTKSSSTPSPFDKIPYQVFKKCPSLTDALQDLFQCCWSSSTVPASWKYAGIKLIGKTSALDNPSEPSNFRPIALTSCVGKLFTTVLKNRWLRYMLSNKYLDRSVQKAFMTATPGCLEHQSKLASILQDAKKKHKSLSVCWLDLANAYGSVHHSLIDFSLRHYHAPEELQLMVQALYSDLSGSVITAEWSTPTIPLQIGVYQGDPLSVVIFNTVINTLVDTLKKHTNLGYSLSPNHQINLLQYADDTCLVANGPAACQSLLNTTNNWLQWSGMRAKVPKCHTLAIQSSSGRVMDPQLTINDQPIPFIGNTSIKFLGMRVEVPRDLLAAKHELKMKLSNLLQAVDRSLVTRHQKLKLFKLGICPRLNWLIMIYEYPLSWIEKELDSMTTRHLKKWAGLAKSANTSLLYLPQQDGGLNLSPPLLALPTPSGLKTVPAANIVRPHRENDR